MSHIFYSNSSLPPLYIGARPDITFYQLMQLVEENVSPQDQKRIYALREYIDVVNIKRVLKKQPIDTRGNFSEKELETAIIEIEGVHPTVLEYLRTYESVEDRLAHFNRLLSNYLQTREEESSGFLKAYYEHERMLRLSLVAYRCAKNGGDIVEELKFEDPKDPFIASLLAQKDTTHFDFPFELEMLTEKLAAASTPLDQYKVIFEHQFTFAEQEGQQRIFSLDFIMAYMMQLIAVENWEATNEKTGTGIIEGMV